MIKKHLYASARPSTFNTHVRHTGLIDRPVCTCVGCSVPGDVPGLLDAFPRQLVLFDGSMVCLRGVLAQGWCAKATKVVFLVNFSVG